MSTSNTLRGRVSRETRQLLTAALVAVLALFVLARIRFPGPPSSPNPIPTLLSQLSPAPRFATLAGEIAELQDRLASSWLSAAVVAAETGPRQVTAMRLQRNTAVLLLRSDDRLRNEQDLVASDPATGLAIIRATGDSTPAGVPPWMPQSLDNPRYLMATVSTPAGVSLRPVLVAALNETRSPAWPAPIWSVPEGTDLTASAFVFTTAGEIAGLVVREPAGLAIVRWDLVVAAATRMLDGNTTPSADLRIEARPLTPALSRATGADAGVIVAWVDSRGPAARRVAVGDVIESINAFPISDMRDWEVASGRLQEGEAVLQVRRRGKPVDVRLSLTAEASVSSGSLGLGMRNVPGVGATVIRIEPHSAASMARLQEGDVITLAGDITAPTAAQIGAAFRSAGPGEVILLAITRGRAHLVVGLVK